MKESKKEQFFTAHSESLDFNSFVLNLPDTKKYPPVQDKQIIAETKNYCTLCILIDKNFLFVGRSILRAVLCVKNFQGTIYGGM